MKEITIKSKDGYELNVHAFEVENPKGYIQLLHGMEEHQERYEGFAKVLNDAGYSFFTSDMRGHGYKAPKLGYFKEKDGYKYLLEDYKAITKYIKDTYKTDKVIIFAHSMGTITTRNLLMSESNQYEKVIMSGFPCPQTAAGLGIVLANIIQAFHGPEYHSKFLQNLAIGGFNKKVKNPKTNLDWLSFDEENVTKYIADPYCGHGFTCSALNDLFHLTKNLGKAKLYHDVNKDLPILLLRGDSDPCTGFDKGAKKSIKVLTKAGFNNIKEVKYDHMRHEILNEKDSQKVHKDVLDFLG
jgi:alpha-beta hydrolase superfamily lysophospholipase